jgi:hypothetical protein
MVASTLVSSRFFPEPLGKYVTTITRAKHAKSTFFIDYNYNYKSAIFLFIKRRGANFSKAQNVKAASRSIVLWRSSASGNSPTTLRW